MTDLSKLLDHVAQAKVAVVGDVGIDGYWELADDDGELSLETGLPVRRVAAQRYTLGGAGNVAAHLVRLGVGQVRVIGVRGSDPFGELLLGLLTEAGLDTRGISELGPDGQTLVWIKPLAGAEEQRRLDLGTSTAVPDPGLELVVEELRAAARWADVVIVNQQARTCFASQPWVDAVNSAISEHPRTRFVVDARVAAPGYKGAILKVNEAEACRLLGRDLDGPASSERASSLAAELFALTGQPVFITRGNRGVVAADGAGVHEVLGVEIPGPVDPVGAGDTVVAVVAAVLAVGGDVPTAAVAANLAAAVTVRQLRTTGVVTADALIDAARSPDYVYEADLAESPHRAQYRNGSEIELIRPLPAHPRISHVIFDHDGTLSTLRQGWEAVMAPVMREAILGPGHAEVDDATSARVAAAISEFIDRTTGIQTLAQMEGLVGLVRRFGFVAEPDILDAHGYKAVYNRALMQLVEKRLAKLTSGQLAPEDYHLKNARPLLARFREAGAKLYLASGTDRADLVAEATALGFGEFFEDRMYGAVGDVAVEAKRDVLDAIIRGHDLRHEVFATFGDGPVEMRETRKRGGIAVGVCSDEIRRHGFNPAKRARLIRGGADILVPDFSDLDAIAALLGVDRP